MQLLIPRREPERHMSDNLLLAVDGTEGHTAQAWERSLQWGQFPRNTTSCSILLAPTAKGIICWRSFLLPLVATSNTQSSVPIAKKYGNLYFRGQLWLDRFPSDSFKEFPVKGYDERMGEIVNAVRALRRMGMRVSLPYQTADGVMFFHLDDYILTATQILELLNKNKLNREGIRAFAEAPKK